MIHKKYEAVIFDLDGTLLDTLQDLADSTNSTLRERNLPTHEIDAYRFFVGSGVTELISRALPEEKRNDNVIADCVKAFREDYGRNWKVNTRLYNGVPELLDALSERHIKMTVLSNKPHEFIIVCIQEFFPDWKFEMILGARDGIPIKPDPTGANEIAENLGLSPSKIVYLGDSGVDMTTAVTAGMLPVGALWGFRPEGELKEHCAVKTIKTPMELLEL